MKKITLLILLFINISFGKNVLFVMSEADTLLLDNGEKKRQTGVFLNEFYEPLKVLIEKGYEINYATPSGKKPTIDNESLEDKYWKKKQDLKNEAIAFWQNDKDFNSLKSLSDISSKLSNYVAIIIPGGQGLMVDLLNNKQIPEILNYFQKENKIIGLICHAPALITVYNQKDNPFFGYKVNSVSGIEEFFIENFIMKGKPEKRKISSMLEDNGLDYKGGFPGSSYALRDRNLITCQNPYSSEEFTKLLVEALSE